MGCFPATVKKLVVCIALFSLVIASASAGEVRVETLEARPEGAPVVKGEKYNSHVTLYIEEEDGSLTPAGWSTRKENGGNDSPFSFSPGVGLIPGWSEGVLQMKVGERAKLHVPSHLGYGSKTMGSKGGPWYIPANSNLCFDIEILDDQKKEL